jgi:hypothetical protein
MTKLLKLFKDVSSGLYEGLIMMRKHKADKFKRL